MNQQTIGIAQIEKQLKKCVDGYFSEVIDHRGKNAALVDVWVPEISRRISRLILFPQGNS